MFSIYVISVIMRGEKSELNSNKRSDLDECSFRPKRAKRVTGHLNLYFYEAIPCKEKNEGFE